MLQYYEGESNKVFGDDDLHTKEEEKQIHIMWNIAVKCLFFLHQTTRIHILMSHCNVLDDCDLHII